MKKRKKKRQKKNTRREANMVEETLASTPRYKKLGDYLVWTGVFLFLACCMIDTIRKKKSLLNHPQYAYAVIIGYWPGAYHYQRAEYIFRLNGNSYKGKGYRYSGDNIGDSILILFDQTNPENSKPYRDFPLDTSLPIIPDSLKR